MVMKLYQKVYKMESDLARRASLLPVSLLLMFALIFVETPKDVILPGNNFSITEWVIRNNYNNKCKMIKRCWKQHEDSNICS